MKSESKRRVADAIVQAGATLYSIAILLPWTPHEREAATDFSWSLMLHHAYLRKLHFGSGIVFTYGPWGFLQGGYHPATFGTVLGCWLLLSAAFVGGIWAAVRRQANPPVAAILTCLLSALVVASGRETLVIVLPLLLFVAARDRGRDRRWLLLLLLVAVGLAALIKFSVLLLAFTLVVLLSVEEVWTRRRVPVAIAAFTAVTLGWWLAASQRVADIAPFIRHGFDLAGNYGEAMGRSEGAAYDVVVVAMMAVASAAAVAAVLAKRDWERAIASAGVLVFFLALLKSGFTRQSPEHTEVASGAFVIAAVALAFEAWPSMSRRGAQAALALVAGACVVLLAAARPRSLREFNPFHVVPTSWSDHRRVLGAQYEERLAPYRDAVRGLQFAGAVDAYPVRLAAILDRADYSPRPVVQSYAVYTTKLATLNAGHLEGVRAPQWVLFDVDPIDHRLPAIEDSLSWPSLLDRYRVAGSGENVLLLGRRGTPVRREIRPLGEMVIRFGETIRVPAGPLWVAFEIEPTLPGRLARIAYRMPPVELRVSTADGTTRDYRLLRDVAKSGFVLSPLIETRDQFAAFSNGVPLAGRHVVSMKLITSASPYLRCDREKVRVTLAAFGR